MQHTTRTARRHPQAGFVSMFTLMFFIVVASIVTVGFLRLVALEARQAQDNSSSNSALAAARAGIEDGKRAILLYNSLPDGDLLKDAIKNAIATQDCDDIYADTNIANALGIETSGLVKTDGLDEQYYTCLTIKPNTPTYEAMARPTKSAIVPLDSATPFQKINVKWHRHGTDGLVDANKSVAGNPSVPALAAEGLPTFMRLQLIKVPNTTSIQGVTSATGFIRTTTVPGSPGAYDSSMFSHDYPSLVGTVYPKDLVLVPTTNCTSGATDYSCNVTLDIGGSSGLAGFNPVDTANNRYFLRLTAVHKPVNVQVSLLDASDAPIEFMMVQPEIDVTGKSGDTLRRLKARVKFAPNISVPEYVVESNGTDPGSGTICKAFGVNASGISGPGGACPLPD